MTDTNDALRAHKTALEKEMADLQASTAPLREKRDALHAQIDALKVQVRDLTQQINAKERPRILELHDEIAKVAKVLGGRSMSDARK